MVLKPSQLLGRLLQAVTLADGVSGAGHPRVVPLLSDLGHVFARTARVMYAEGIYRCCARVRVSSLPAASHLPLTLALAMQPELSSS
jgi:hypothetical protein